MSAASDDLRLPPQSGEWIDRSEEISFSFEGLTFTGFGGDVIASALAANGIRMLSRSFKYRRPRGILTMAGQDANTLVQLPGEPNVLADRHPIAPGLEVMGQNYTGSLKFDRGAYIERFARFLPVGFYYKTFYKPRGAWKFWEPIVRARAGLGKIDESAPHGYYDKAYDFCDVAVVGGGPAGMSAALAAAEAGAEVLLFEEHVRLGGSGTYARFAADDGDNRKRIADLIAAVEGEANIRVMTDATCNGLFVDNWLPVLKDKRLYKVRAGRVVLATGSIEQPAIFRNNDLLGVMQGSAAQRLIRQYAVKPGARALVLTANGDGYGVALDLLDAGIEVAAVADLRQDLPPCARADAVRDHGVPIHAGHTVWEALPDKHTRGVVAAHLAPVTGQGTCAPNGTFADCDLLVMSPGYTPTGQLLSHAGGKLRYDGETDMFSIAECPAGLSAAGSVNGAYALDATFAEGRHAGWAAAKELGLAVGGEPPLANDRGGHGVTHPWPIFPHPKGKDFVDFDEDLQVHDILDAIDEGYDHIELLKRFSTVGMGPSQGRHSSLATVRLAAHAKGEDVAEVGMTTSRPPFTAEKIGLLAGRGFEPERRTAMHHRHVEMGAQMMLAGLWYRPAYYGPASDRDRLTREEAVNVRDNVGIIDVSTLGGLDIRGPDAAEFLNRMYTFAYLKQPVGRSRYVLMCDDTGAIVDDGVACRFGDEHFYVTATTGGVDGVYQKMLWWNAQWRLDIDITNVTAALAGVNIAGPRSRDVLRRLCDDVDLSADAFPYMGIREGTVAGIPARLLRVGFVGELGYEIHVPASQGEALWDALLDAGAPEGIRPFGVETQRLLRLEKGHIIIGQDTDGLTHPHEAHMSWAIARKKPFFVGGRAIDIQMKRPLTRQLVGFVLPDPWAPVPEECHLTVRDGAITGRVTSAAYSPALDRIVGLAYVAPDQAENGTRFDIKIAGGALIQGDVVPLPFYDPDNTRQEM